MSYQTDHAALQARVEQEQQDAMDAKFWLAFLEKHREIAPCEANFQAMKSYFAGDPFSPEALDESLQNPSLRNRMAFQTTVEDRINLLQTLKKLTGEIPAATKYQSTEEIRAKVEEIQTEKVLQQKSPAELRAFIKQNTPAVEADDLPEHMNRQFLLDLKGPEFKKVCERYGVAAVTRALNNRR